MAYPDCECKRYNHHLKMCVCEWDEAVEGWRKPRHTRRLPYLTKRGRDAYVEAGWMSPDAPYIELVDPTDLGPIHPKTGHSENPD